MGAALVFAFYESHAQILAEREAVLKAVDDSALSVLSFYEEQERSGAISRDTAQKEALAQLSRLRYGENGYVWVNDMNRVMLMHPFKPELNGKDLSDMKDPDGLAIFVEFVKVARQGGGYLEYAWPKPGVETPVAKLSYVTAFQPWGWVIGNGVYIDDLEARFWSGNRQVLAIAGAAALLLTLGAVSIIRSVTGPLRRLGSVMHEIAEENFSADVTEVSRRDEIGDMARQLVLLRDSVNDRVQKRLRQAEAQRLEIERQQRAVDEERLQRAESLQVVIDQLGAGLDRLSVCDIRETIDSPFEGEFERLRANFNVSMAMFQKVLEEVLQKTRTFDGNCRDLSQQADQLAARTEQQAASLEETAAAVEEINANLRSAAERTETTRQHTAVMRREVKESADVVRRAVTAMERIEQASAKISSITGVIDEIAFQTNLLALNAGIEAARAGEAGRGFAVVAQEVRELAQRSAMAAREISDLIQQSNVEVHDGVGLVRETGSALEKFEMKVVQIASDVEAIAVASAEQSTGLMEVSQSINQMDQITQKNAAMVEETTAATHDLAAQAKLLAELVNTFKLNRRNRQRDPNAPVYTDEMREQIRRGQLRVAA
nr:methyl-accepting chemotaxis protein [Gellertiella hungarica]